MVRSSSLAIALGTALLSATVMGGETSKEYVPADAEQEVLANQTGLASGQSLEAKVVRFRVGPGFRTARHYHTGDVFVYVRSGQLRIETDEGERIVQAGQVYYEIPNQPMVGANVSATEDAEIVIFQVGRTGEPMMIEAH